MKQKLRSRCNRSKEEEGQKRNRRSGGKCSCRSDGR